MKGELFNSGLNCVEVATRAQRAVAAASAASSSILHCAFAGSVGGFEKIRVDHTRDGPSLIKDIENAGIENSEGVNFSINKLR